MSNNIEQTIKLLQEQVANNEQQQALLEWENAKVKKALTALHEINKINAPTTPVATVTPKAAPAGNNITITDDELAF